MQPSSPIMTVTASWALRGDPSLGLTFVQLEPRYQKGFTSSTVEDLHLGKMPKRLFPYLTNISQARPFMNVEA